MTLIKDFRKDDSDQVIQFHRVAVGDWVSFRHKKSAIKQSGKVIGIDGDWLTLKSPFIFKSDHPAGKCWIE